MISFEDIQENWAIIMGFVAGLVAWGETRRTAASAKDSSTKAHARLDSSNAETAIVKQSIARLETHAEYTREGIDEIKKSIQELRKT